MSEDEKKQKLIEKIAGRTDSRSFIDPGADEMDALYAMRYLRTGKVPGDIYRDGFPLLREVVTNLKGVLRAYKIEEYGKVNFVHHYWNSFLVLCCVDCSPVVFGWGADCFSG